MAARCADVGVVAAEEARPRCSTCHAAAAVATEAAMAVVVAAMADTVVAAAMAVATVIWGEKF